MTVLHKFLKLFLSVSFVALSQIVYATTAGSSISYPDGTNGNGLPRSFQKPSTQIQQKSVNLIGYINQILVVIIFGGIIYIASALVGKKEVNNSAVMAWFVCLVIWGIARLFFSV